MYINPNTTVRLLKGVHLDLDHTHTINFSSKSVQESYFARKTKFSVSDYSYQRHSKNQIRVGILADQLYDCDYLMFQNTSYGNKWFYAFITNVEYVNDNASIVEYKIDVIQTWLFETKFEPCFIERTHTRTDNIGDNIQPEPVALGEYVVSDNIGYTPITNIQDLVTIIMVADRAAEFWGFKFDGVYSGCSLYAFENNSPTFTSDITQFIDKNVQKPDSIIGMYTAPKALIKYSEESHLIISSTENISIKYKAEPIKSGDTIGGARSSYFEGYVPKNNKLYTYPYNFYHVDNGMGNELSLRYEFFKDLQPSFLIRGTALMPVNVICLPTDYKGSVGVAYHPETLSLSNYPLCSWTVDSYQAWIAQNAVPTLINVGEDSLQALMVGAINPTLGLASMATKVGNGLSRFYQASIQADICKGTVASGNVNVSKHEQNFYGCRMSINSDDAKSIDNYFTMFGYAINKLSIPNRNNRTEYTYIKTIGCQVTGSFSEQDKQEIVDIHDNGITYWNNPEHVGNYSVTNTPRG